MRQTIFKGILKFMVITDTLAMLSLCIILASSVAEFPGLVTAVIQREVGGWSCGRQHPALYGSFRKKQKKNRKVLFLAHTYKMESSVGVREGFVCAFTMLQTCPSFRLFYFSILSSFLIFPKRQYTIAINLEL